MVFQLGFKKRSDPLRLPSKGSKPSKSLKGPRKTLQMDPRRNLTRNFKPIFEKKIHNSVEEKAHGLPKRYHHRNLFLKFLQYFTRATTDRTRSRSILTVALFLTTVAFADPSVRGLFAGGESDAAPGSKAPGSKADPAPVSSLSDAFSSSASFSISFATAPDSI